MADTKTSSGIGFGTLIFLVLIVLKATGQIGMSWFWVITSIIWAPLALIGVIFSIVGLIAIIASLFTR